MHGSRDPVGGGAGVTAWSSGFVDVTGGRLAYHRTGGPGPPLLLSHGLTDNGLCWSRFTAAMEADFDVIMLDARGHGESSRLDEPATHDAGRDIAEAIDRLGLIAPVVMGHSLGARATAACAAANPGLVARVVLEDPPLLPPAEPSEVERRRARFRKQVEKLRAMTDAEITAMGKALSPDWHDDEFPAWTAAKRQVDPEALPAFDAPWQASIAAIAVPTLLIHGDPDRGGLVTPVIAAEAVGLNAQVEAVRIAGAGHNIRRENLPDTLSAVRGFLLGP
jgi:pimeloyl-ACP methyl ester carboxylesterase